MNKTCALIITVLALNSTFLNGQDEPPVSSSGIQKKAIILASPQGGNFAAPIRLESIQISGAPADGAAWSFSTTGPGEMLNSVSFGGMTDFGSLLQNESVQKELDIVSDQVAKFRAAQQRRQAEIQKAMSGLLPSLGGDDGKKTNRSVKLMGSQIQEMVKKHKEETEKELRELLLDHQYDRLKQISRQVNLKRRGTLFALTNSPLKEDLGFTDKEIKKLKDRASEINRETEEKIAKIRAEAKEKLLSELSTGQRKKLKELTGKEFDYRPTDFLSRIRKRSGSDTKKKETPKK